MLHRGLKNICNCQNVLEPLSTKNFEKQKVLIEQTVGISVDLEQFRLKHACSLFSEVPQRAEDPETLLKSSGT